MGILYALTVCATGVTATSLISVASTSTTFPRARRNPSYSSVSNSVVLIPLSFRVDFTSTKPKHCRSIASNTV